MIKDCFDRNDQFDFSLFFSSVLCLVFPWHAFVPVPLSFIVFWVLYPRCGDSVESSLGNGCTLHCSTYLHRAETVVNCWLRKPVRLQCQWAPGICQFPLSMSSPTLPPKLQMCAASPGGPHAYTAVSLPTADSISECFDLFPVAALWGPCLYKLALGTHSSSKL